MLALPSHAEANFFARIFGGLQNVFSRKDGTNKPTAAIPVAETRTVADPADQQDRDRRNESEIYIRIDRAPNKQSLEVFEKGQLIKTCKISTGRETFDTPTNFNKAPYCSVTPRGYFQPQSLKQLHQSMTWLVRNEQTNEYDKGTDMPNSVFFNGGIATHEAIGPGLAKLGPKDQMANGGSGGCVRLDPDCSKFVFDLIAKKNAESPTGYAIDVAKHKELCAKSPEDPRCVNPMLWPVSANGKNVRFHVVDDRGDNGGKAAEACEQASLKFDVRKTQCLIRKMGEGDAALKAKIDAHTLDFAVDFKALPQDKQNSYNYACNEEIYKEDHVPVPTPADRSGLETSDRPPVKTGNAEAVDTPVIDSSDVDSDMPAVLPPPQN